MPLTPLDNKLSNAAVMRFVGAGGAVDGEYSNSVSFQFPPRILTDNRRGEWVGADLPGNEPVSNYKSSSAREFTVKWSYVVGELGGSNETGKPIIWTTTDVKKQVLGLRSYFGKSSLTGKSDNLVIFFNLWLYGGPKEMCTRMLSVNVSHGTTIVVPDGDTALAYPLRTDISVDLRIWNRGGSGYEGDEKNNINLLCKTTPVEWY